MAVRYCSAPMSRSADQLPRGRHGIPREEVLASQRGRMLVAMTEAVAERGFAKVTVADVIRRAGVSRETFYEQFDGKEDCFLAALDGASALLAGGLSEAFAEQRDPVARLEVVLAAYLETMAAEPAAARTFLIEVYAAGPQALARRVATINRFTDLIQSFVPQVDRLRCEALTGAISSMVTMRVATGDHESLPALREPLLALGVEVLGLER
jgi:AcrR family transcriptional regulator